MSAMIEGAVAVLSARLTGGFDGVAKFVVPGEGSLMMDAGGVRAGDDPAEVTLTASAETFAAIMSGELNPTVAFMTGRLSVDGDMGAAMKLGAALS